MLKKDREAAWRAGRAMSNALYNWAQSEERLPLPGDRRLADQMRKEWDRVAQALHRPRARAVKMTTREGG